MTEPKTSIRPSYRRAAIRDYIEKRGQASIEELAQKFTSSTETVRRDLKTLADAGQIRKIHGGACRLDVSEEGPFEARMARNTLAKQVVAEKVRELVMPGQTLFIDTGSTTLICAQLLARIRKLRVVTNSVLIADVFAKGSGEADVTLLGGRFRSDNHQTVGAETVQEIRNFQLDHAMLTVGAIDGDGLLDISEEEAQVARAMIRSSRTLTVVADLSKLCAKGQYRLCGFEDVTNLVLDEKPDSSFVERVTKAGVTLY
ncbi:DeoR/GlpR family DNA-binding transcription regulator [uncultured Cohaesibacter sp.]|uniref:DeoR/GlpR family DNA-binding transcription regulator n=1 Tax=uncultured Cohaesibacter sp. TaxID=1002546 RepID=UPI0029C99EDE|nr:DeoR/GlpR family DNA-binding transcription regulator [uncultured Cohaesibacter sp.]